MTPPDIESGLADRESNGSSRELFWRAVDYPLSARRMKLEA